VVTIPFGVNAPVTAQGAAAPDVDVEGGLKVGAGAIGVSVGMGAVGLTTGEGLRPPPANSVEPNGMPARPTDSTPPIAVGDDADAAAFPVAALPLAVQPLVAVPLMPPPSKTVLELVLELAVPHDVVPFGDTPGSAGLMPGDASSIAPRGMPVGATVVPGPMPSGEVMPSGDTLTCARAEPQPRRATASVAAAQRIVMAPSLSDRRRASSRGRGDTRLA
jgi:hypothetical protein